MINTYVYLHYSTYCNEVKTTCFWLICVVKINMNIRTFFIILVFSSSFTWLNWIQRRHFNANRSCLLTSFWSMVEDLLRGFIRAATAAAFNSCWNKKRDPFIAWNKFVLSVEIIELDISKVLIFAIDANKMIIISIAVVFSLSWNTFSIPWRKYLWTCFSSSQQQRRTGAIIDYLACSCKL